MIQSTEEFRLALKAARVACTPLVVIRTADPASAINQVVQAIVLGASLPLIGYDLLSGLAGCNEKGQAVIPSICEDGITELSPEGALQAIEKAEKETVCLFHNMHRHWETNPAVIQGIWNLRDSFKLNGRMLVMLVPPGATVPIELTNDVFMLDEPLPSTAELEKMITEMYGFADMTKPKANVVEKAVDALIGLAAFPAEQVLAMSLDRKKGLDVESLWERKRQVIEQVPGLSVWRGGETFADIGGCTNIKEFLVKLIQSKEPPRVIVFIDEIEKAFAGSGTDMSGVKTGMTGTMLTWMQDRGAEGMIFLGPPGAAKSAVAKATGASAGIPTIAFDFDAMQNALIGSSGERLRSALQIVDAVSQGRSLWIATCNSIGSLPPELRRRFQLGTFFFDLPNKAEREAIWKIYQTKWGLNGTRPADEGWTGAEIRECCRKAWKLGITLVESGRYIVPISKSASDQISQLRQQASGKFLDAGKAGVYTYTTQTHEAVGTGVKAAGRRFQ